MEHNLNYQCLSQLGEQILALFEKPEGTPKANPEGGKWLILKEISARLKKVYRSTYAKNEGIYVKIGHFLNRPEYKFENERRKHGMTYWLKER